MGSQYRKPRTGCQPRWRFWVDNWLQATLPAHCLLCGGRHASTALCRGCREDLPWLGPACELCALPLPRGAGPSCGACLTKPPPWDRAHAALAYRFPADVLVHSLKYRRELAAGRALAKLMAAAPGGPTVAGAALLVPVPLHRWRQASRGYNQATEIACELARLTGLELGCRNLRRSRRAPPQTGLDAATRRRNLRGAFRWHGPGLRRRNIVLVDDVMTTGSTAAECTRALRAAGAGEVRIWVAARAAQPEYSG